jgi:hypothetical protein
MVAELDREEWCLEMARLIGLCLKLRTFHIDHFGNRLSVQDITGDPWSSKQQVLASERKRLSSAARTEYVCFR